MERKERALAALNNQKVDRPPVGFWHHFSGDEARGQGCIDAHLDYLRRVELDFVKVMSDGFFTFPFGFDVKEPADLRKTKPLEADHPYIASQVERCKTLRKILGNDICMFYNVFNPYSAMSQGAGNDFVMRAIAEDPEAYCIARDAIGRTNALLCEKLLTEGGCDGVYFCVQGGETWRFTRDEYKRFIEPGDLMVLEHANKFSDNNILHCCGWAGDKNDLSLWKDYPAKAINYAMFIEGISLKEAKEFFGGRCIMGGFDNRPTGLIATAKQKQEIRAYTYTLLDANQYNGLIIGADCAFKYDTDVQPMQWVVECVKEYYNK